jgi:hypothetical protein
MFVKQNHLAQYKHPFVVFVDMRTSDFIEFQVMNVVKPRGLGWFIIYTETLFS